QLARLNNTAGGSISQTSLHSKEVKGAIKRIAELPSNTLGGAPSYMFIIDGDPHTFVVSRDTYIRIPLVREGDQVTFTFLETNSAETAVDTFKCEALDAKVEQKK
ncbi:MAG: hypothetical protein K2Z81_22425, partial [Cyanobacteria bacterium]|nr:hypothetical protein [Cyanobacteriota bacterium]